MMVRHKRLCKAPDSCLIKSAPFFAKNAVKTLIDKDICPEFP